MMFLFFILFPAILALLCCVLIGFLCFIKRFRLALLLTSFQFLLVIWLVAGACFVSSLYPSYVCNDEAVDVVCGEYVVDFRRSNYMLSLANIDKCNAAINLESSGRFYATNLPVCCIYGAEPTFTSVAKGVCNIRGKWRVERLRKSYGIRFEIDDVQILNQNSPEFKLINIDEVLGGNPIDVFLLKGSPNLFSFDFIVWSPEFDDSELNRIIFRKKDTLESSNPNSDYKTDAP